MSELLDAFEILLEAKTKLSKYNIRKMSYKELCKIFNVDSNLQEDKDTNKAYLFIANDYYKKLLEKVKNKDYEKCRSGAICIKLEDLIIFIDYGDFGNYNKSHYDPENNYIYVYTKNLNSIYSDYIFRSNFMHEITHYLYKNENDSSLPWNYKAYNENEIKYYTQPSEIMSNKISICNFLCNEIIYNINRVINKENLLSDSNLQAFINSQLNFITSHKGFIYHNFLVALSKDKKAFNDFYNEILENCIEYVRENFEECTMYSMYHELQENLSNLFKEKEMNNILDEGDKKIFTKGNTHYNSSEDELYYYDLLKKKWPDVIMSYTDDRMVSPDTHRHWQMDFYIPSKDMAINLNKHIRHGRRPYNPADPNCQKDVRWLKSKAEPGNFYEKILHTWTELDPLKRKIAKDTGLKYIEIFNMDEFNTWYNNPELTYEEYKFAPESMQYNSNEYFKQKARHRDIYGNDSKWDE